MYGIDKYIEEVAKIHKTIQKRSYMTQITIMHLEPDILECKVKWALGSITAKLLEVMEFQ